MTQGSSEASTVPTENLCRLCKSRPAMESGTICRFCMGLERAPDLPNQHCAAQILQPSPITLDAASLICPICGITHAGFKMGRNSTSKVCKECVVAKRKLTKAKNQNKAVDFRRKLTGKTLPKIKDQEHSLMSTANENPSKSVTANYTPTPRPADAPPPRMITPKDLDHQLLLDFTDYPELLNRIKQIAWYEMRTPKAQIFWMIKHADVNEG